jgi:hypothetical protein
LPLLLNHEDPAVGTVLKCQALFVLLMQSVDERRPRGNASPPVNVQEIGESVKDVVGSL